jgi:3',5'-nucleoside bisphosphate phosphatase
MASTAQLLPLPPDAAIDMHLHTRYSDGRWRPVDLFETLAQHAFRLVSVVDHDQLDHLPEMMALGAERGIGVIAGTEVTTAWRGLAAHLLCYAPLPSGFTGDALSRLIDDTRTRMRANTRMIYDAMLARGYTFPRQAEILADRGGKLNRAMDVGDLLVAHGYAAGPAEAFQMVTAAGYQQILALIEQAVAAAHASGALCLLAHPGRSEGEIHRYEPVEVEALLAEVPLDGIEVYYPTHTAEQVAAYAALAERRNLLASAGSDSHGPHQRLPLAYPAQRIAALLERLGVTLG